MHGRHPPAGGVEGKLSDARHLRDLLLLPQPALLGEDDERALGRVAEDGPAGGARDELAVVAEQPCAKQLGERGRVDDPPVGAEAAERLVAGALDLQLAVRRPDLDDGELVLGQRPGLAVQMTVVSPSVSTEERRGTSAFRRAIRWVASPARA